MKKINLAALSVTLILLMAVFAACNKKGGDSASKGKTAENVVSVTDDAMPAAEEPTAEKAMPVVYDFHATWCGPCQEMEPDFLAVAEKYEGRVKFVRIDVDQNPKLADQYSIRVIPTIIVIKPNGDKQRAQGKLSQEELCGLIDRALK